MRWPEFYPEKQGRPFSRQVIDAGTNLPAYGGSYTTVKELIEMQQELSDKLAELESVLVKSLIELRQIKLHLASISEENISEEDADD